MPVWTTHCFCESVCIEVPVPCIDITLRGELKGYVQDDKHKKIVKSEIHC